MQHAQEDRADSLAAKLNCLFERAEGPDGSPPSNRQVAASINAAAGEQIISHSYISLLRNGHRDNPTFRQLEVLANYFDVSPAFFFDHDEIAAQVAEGLRFLTSLHTGDVSAPSPRADGLTAELLDHVNEVMGQIERSRQPASVPPAAEPPVPF
ncbi:helix-turn-helix domain-containing protein [Streptomyces rimosus]|uniref:helix-turn-helix domain-containing protein n=1 Tax=Streptomyces rimosus TaxID=1927 RepID=UPI00131ECF20|nr:helix-turn-helix transcriptional regulator [Streptomyces rimosus]